MLLAGLPACVSRKLMLRSDPPGARVLIDDQEVGTTPWEGDFGSYGTRRIEFGLPGYERHVELYPITIPWWQVYPVDMVSELLIPWTIEDLRVHEVTLTRLSAEQADLDWAAARQALESARHERESP